MPELQTQITDTELLAKIRSSNLEDRQKQELENLLPRMTQEERAKLIDLIHQGSQNIKEAEAKYQQEIKKLNQEYTEKLDHAVAEGKETANKIYEKAEKREEAGEIEKLESEIETVKQAPQKQTQKAPAKKHGAVKFLFILALLVAIAIGAWYGLSLL